MIGKTSNIQELEYFNATCTNFFYLRLAYDFYYWMQKIILGMTVFLKYNLSRFL